MNLFAYGVNGGRDLDGCDGGLLALTDADADVGGGLNVFSAVGLFDGLTSAAVGLVDGVDIDDDRRWLNASAGWRNSLGFAEWLTGGGGDSASLGRWWCERQSRKDRWTFAARLIHFRLCTSEIMSLQIQLSSIFPRAAILPLKLAFKTCPFHLHRQRVPQCEDQSTHLRISVYVSHTYASEF